MARYHWGFEKAYSYLHSKKPDIGLNRGFVQQLLELERRQLLRRCNKDIENQSKADQLRMKDWDVSYIASLRQLVRPSSVADQLLAEELLLINSFNNSKQTLTSLPGPYRGSLDQPKSFLIKFNPIPQEGCLGLPGHRHTQKQSRQTHGIISAMKGSRATNRILQSQEPLASLSCDEKNLKSGLGPSAGLEKSKSRMRNADEKLGSQMEDDEDFDVDRGRETDEMSDVSEPPSPAGGSIAETYPAPASAVGFKSNSVYSEDTSTPMHMHPTLPDCV